VRLRFEMSGGVAGLYAARPLVWDAELSDLPDAERAALEGLLAASGLLDVTPPAARTPHPDAFVYELTFTDAGRARTVVLDDVTAPAAARPLLQHLRQRAQAERAKG